MSNGIVPGRPRAPLSEMSADMAEIQAGLEAGQTLPAAWYTEPGVLRFERERIFRRTWQYVGPLEWVAKPGDYFTAQAGHVPLVVARDADGTLRGFVNVCRHRGHEVASGSGNRRTLQCIYHGWTYGLDGTLRAAPRSERERTFDMAGCGLMPVAVDTWGQLVFANPDPAAAPLAATLGNLPELTAARDLPIGACTFRERRRYEVAGNWKAVIENGIECYHCPTIHPSLAARVETSPDVYRLDAHGSYFSLVSCLRETAARHPLGDWPIEMQGYFLWPNLMFAGGRGTQTSFAMAVTVPVDAGRSRMVYDYFYAPEIDDQSARAIIDSTETTTLEDVAVIESVQRGLASGMVEHGRLLLDSENLIHEFQLMVFRALASG